MYRHILYDPDQVRGYHLSLHSQAPLEIGCKDTNKRAKYKEKCVFFCIFEREYLRAQLKDSANRAKLKGTNKRANKKKSTNNLPISAKISIFAARIGSKTCR